MNPPYRYPGAKPFDSSQKNVFFGRDEDVENMLRLIELEESLVLYGKSGLGKSSLINAGIVPKIEDKGRYLPINIRFQAFTKEKEDMPLDIARQCIESKETWLQKIKGDDKASLWYHLKNHQIEDEAQGYLLIFDQFEELFTYPEEAVADFARELSEIIYTRIPDRFREEFEKKRNDFSKEQMETLHTPLDLKVLIAIRSDRMSLMNRLKPHLPDVLLETYEILPLTEIQAEDAILNPAYMKGDFMSPIFDYEDNTLMAILDFLTEKRTENVESFQLQILCQHVEQLVIENGLKEVTLEDIGDIESVYENYYLNQIERLGDEKTQLAARRLIEEGLIFEAEERRLSLFDVQIDKHYQVDTALLSKLVDSHLLRAEPSLKGGYTYELSHDTLVAPVLGAKAQRLRVETERQEKKAAKSRRIKMILFLFTTLAISAAVIGYALYNLAEAKEKNEETVGLLLADAKQNIANMEYEEALEKMKIAARLGVRKVEVAGKFLELAYRQNEMGNIQRMEGILDTMKKELQLRKYEFRTSSSWMDDKEFPTLLKKYTPGLYIQLKYKYYPRMIDIKGGTFEMGCNSNIDNLCKPKESLHNQTISNYSIGTYEVTWEQYILFCDTINPKIIANWDIKSDHPVIRVSWNDAAKYTNWLSKKQGMDTTYLFSNNEFVGIDSTANGYRLPTEAEWEYAANGARPQQKYRYSGSDIIDSVAWYSGNNKINGTKSVGKKQANVLGIYDMTGNVAEWCEDWDGDYEEHPEKDYRGAITGTYRVARGGGWDESEIKNRLVNRVTTRAPILNTLGFRVVGPPSK